MIYFRYPLSTVTIFSYKKWGFVDLLKYSFTNPFLPIQWSVAGYIPV